MRNGRNDQKTVEKVKRKIPTALRTFESFLNATMPADSITIYELKQAFFSLKRNKSPRYDEISSNVIKNCFSELNKYLIPLSIYLKRP